MHGKICWSLLTFDSHLENKPINRTAEQQRGEEEKRILLSKNPIVWVFCFGGVGGAVSDTYFINKLVGGYGGGGKRSNFVPFNQTCFFSIMAEAGLAPPPGNTIVLNSLSTWRCV